MKRKNAFTLIELLVVVTIIVLLLAMLLPALNRALATAHAAVCSSNQRQINTAWAVYASDNFGSLPGAETSRPNFDWVVIQSVPEQIDTLKAGTLWQYMDRNASVYACPDEWRPSYIRTYSFNNFLAGTTGSTWHVECVYTRQAIPRPSATLTTLEEPDPRGACFGSWVIYPGQSPWKDTWIDWATSHHFNGAVLGFADGHNELKIWSDSRTATIDWFWISTPDNPDLVYMQSIYNTNDKWVP